MGRLSTANSADHPGEIALSLETSRAEIGNGAGIERKGTGGGEEAPERIADCEKFGWAAPPVDQTLEPGNAQITDYGVKNQASNSDSWSILCDL